MKPVWSGEWKKKLLERVESKGFKTIHEMLNARKGKTYHQIALELGEDIAQAQIVMTHLQQCADEGHFIDGASECLARIIIEELTHGWNKGFRVDYRTASAFGEWFSAVVYTEQSEMERKELDSVSTVLRNDVCPPEGWLPEDGRDPLIQKAFDIVKNRAKL
ncbi:MAG: hypothetical protein JXR76_28375 [Deltaproteobacteria bacterium]|nr:hypothetical protein [Deltaproteobacteria bacterium]